MSKEFIVSEKNLCDNCPLEFATCKAKPVFAIDRYPEARDDQADKVIECSERERYLDSL